MRIGILTNTFPPNKDGVSVAVESLYQNLHKLGHKVYIVTPQIPEVKYSQNILALPSFELDEKISTDRRLSNLYSSEIVKFFKKNRIQIIHSQDTISGGAEAVLVGLQLDIPTIHTFHTLVEEYQYYSFPGYKPLVRKYLGAVCNSYDCVIAPSEKIYKHLLKMGVKIPITLISNVPNLKPLKKPINQDLITKIKTQINYRKNDQICLTFCRLALEKGLYEGINSLKSFLKNNPKGKYLIAGGGPEEQKLSTFIREHNLQNKVFLLGNYDRSDLSSICSLAKVFIYTSQTDNLPTNIFEAMYFGLPVVSINDLSVDYLLINGINGFKSSLNKISENVTKLFKSPILLKKFGGQAKLATKKLKPKIIVEEHLKLYNQIIKKFEQQKLVPIDFTNRLEKLEKIINKGFNPIGKLYKKLFIQE